MGIRKGRFSQVLESSDEAVRAHGAPGEAVTGCMCTDECAWCMKHIYASRKFRRISCLHYPSFGFPETRYHDSLCVM